MGAEPAAPLDVELHLPAQRSRRFAVAVGEREQGTLNLRLLEPPYVPEPGCGEGELRVGPCDAWLARPLRPPTRDGDHRHHRRPGVESESEFGGWLRPRRVVLLRLRRALAPAR